ncbi:hypothetical protein H0H93_003515 [Arthromyces matolae]|nr:hypothetical protein H0H93_003515 [Arthromyces matolae]
MARPLGAQEREVKDQIKKAKGHPDKTGLVRQDALKRLIEITHAPHPNLKIIAAQNISFFFTDFPDLEEDAINAVYDLCEDQSSAVRVEGYTAVTNLSKADGRLVRRNADVLIQLLQSDERDEVEIVKKALLDHLELDPKVTLGVICDQMSPLDDSVDDDEKEIRDRMRKVVLRFLTEDARKVIVERCAIPGSDAEESLLENMLAVIPKLAYKDTEIIVEEIILKLKSFQTQLNAPRGSDLLKVLLNKISQPLSNANRSTSADSLHSVQLYMDLTSFLVVEKRVAPAILLLRECCSSVVTKINLQKFSPDDQQLVVCSLAEIYYTANDQQFSLNDDGPAIDTLTRVIVDSSPFLLEALRLTEGSSPRHIKACKILLQACKDRQQSASWSPRPNLVSVLSAIATRLSRSRFQDLLDLIRSLVPLPSTSAKPQEQSAKISSALQSSTNGEPSTGPLAARPSTNQFPVRRMHVATSSRHSGPRPSSTEPAIHLGLASMKHQLPPDVSTRPTKRQKNDAPDNRETDSGPSLLSRMGTTSKVAPKHRTSLTPVTTTTTVERPHVPDAPPQTQLSIKGAASLSGRSTKPPSLQVQQSATTSKSSLLERLEGSTASGARRGRGR